MSGEATRHRAVGGPVLSAVFITPNCFETIRDAVRKVHEQGIRTGIEAVIVAPSAASLAPDRELLDGFFDWRVVEVGPIEVLGEAEAAGIRSSRAPVVVYVEEHSHPEPGWAEGLVAAHGGPWTAVGPAVVNANPASRVSRASFLLDFGDWPATSHAGPMTRLASHQTSYKRAPLLEYGARLGALIEVESVLQADLVANGHRLYFESAARTRHLNVSRLSDFLRVEFANCRTFGANRATAERWSRARRFAYVAGLPAIPVLRGARMLGPLRRARLGLRTTLGLLPALGAGLLAAAAGEVTGYALGSGAPGSRLTFELDRQSHLAPSDGARR